MKVMTRQSHKGNTVDYTQYKNEVLRKGPPKR